MCAYGQEQPSLAARLRSIKTLLSSRQVCDLFAVHQETLYRWVADGFPHSRVRGRLRFDPATIAAFLEERSVR